MDNKEQENNILKEEFAKRLRRNPSYSLRSFANLLEINSGSLSSMMNGKRKIPLKKLEMIATKLSLSPKQKHLLYIHSGQTKWNEMENQGDFEKKALKKVLTDQEHSEILSEWEFFAVLNLLETKGNDFRAKSMAERLAIPQVRMDVVLQKLINQNMVSQNSEGYYKREVRQLKTSEDVFSVALNKAHLEELDIAKEKLLSTEQWLRDYSSITMAVDINQIEIAKQLIRDFRKKVSECLEQGNQSEVYNLNIQLYPLTKINTDGVKK